MHEWPVDPDLDARLRRMVLDEIAATDARQIAPRRSRAGTRSPVRLGVAIAAVVVIVAALVWRGQSNSISGDPSASSSASPTATDSASPTPALTPAETTLPTPSATPIAGSVGTPGPSANPALVPSRQSGCWLEQAVAVTLKDGRVLITGGCLPDGGTSPASSLLFDPATGLFHATGAMAAARKYEPAVLLRDGRVLLVGGLTDPSGMSNTDELYDPATGRFTPVGPVVKPRAAGGAALLDDGRVLIVGGDQDLPAADTAEIFDPATGRFTAAGSMAPGDMSTGGPISTVKLPDGKVAIFGAVGDLPDGLANRRVLTQIYDPATNTFTASKSQLPSDGSVFSIGLPDGRVFVLSGETGGRAEVYDPGTDKFTRLASMPTPLQTMSATKLADGRILVLGSVISELAASASAPAQPGRLLDLRPTAAPGTGARYSVVPVAIAGQVYDPASNHWTYLGHLNVERSDTAVAVLPDGRVLIVGGTSPLAEIFDPRTGKFTVNE